MDILDALKLAVKYSRRPIDEDEVEMRTDAAESWLNKASNITGY
jgi:hypothetical protein